MQRRRGRKKTVTVIHDHKKKKNSMRFKKAYHPAKKKKFQKKRQPFVESKTRTSEDVFLKLKDSATPNGGIPIDTLGLQYIPLDDAYTGIQLSPLTFMTQGVEEDDMIGRSIYAKYLKTKVQITWPVKQYFHPAELFLVHGFIKLSPNLTSYTTPPIRGTGNTWDAYREWTSENLKDYFNERKDKLRFIPKQNSTIHISGYKKLRPNLQKQYSMPVQLDSDDKPLGSVPDTFVSINHKMMRKYHYEKANNNTQPELFFINMNQWVPFACLYNPEFASTPTDGDDDLIKVRTNTILYYSDS